MHLARFVAGCAFAALAGFAAGSGLLLLAILNAFAALFAARLPGGKWL